MQLPIFTVDAFSQGPFTGNPAAVCLLDAPRSDAWMQSVAAEMNLPETAFLLKLDSGWSLRWLSPTVEVDICGHATIAASHILWQEGLLQPTETVIYHTRSGQLTAKQEGQTIVLDFPALPAKECASPKNLSEGLGVVPLLVGSNEMDYLALLEDEETVRNLSPKLDTLRSIDCRGIIVTAKSNSSEYDFVSRFFAPATGINEDPATGSSHCCLAPFWAARLGKSRLIGRQLSARGGVIGAELVGERVLLRGSAVTILRGELSLEASA